MKKRRRSVATGLLAGLAGGLVASWTMNQFQVAWSKGAELINGDKSQSENSQQGEQSEQDSEDATMKLADKLGHALLSRGLSKDEKKHAGPIVHYAFGAAMGALYGVAAALQPEVTLGFGTAFGAGLFAVADEVAVPAFGLSKNPTEYPLSSHASALASHLVYGATTEGVRRAVTQVA